MVTKAVACAVALVVLGAASSIGVAQVELEFVTPVWQPDAVRVVNDIVKEWNEQNPEIQVKTVSVRWEQLNTYLLTRFQAGDGPDIFHQDAVMAYEYGVMGYAEPLNAYLGEEELADTPQRNWGDVSDEYGEIYGIPFLQETLVIFYNRELFDEAGLEVPENRMLSWEQLREYAQILTTRDEDGNVTTWGLFAPLEQRLWWALVAQNDGRVLREDEDGAWYVDIDEPAREAITYYTELVTVDRVMPVDVLSYDFMPLYRSFRTGEYAMFAYGCWVRQWLVRLAPDFEWGMLWVEGPVREVTLSIPQAVALDASSEHKDEAMEFLTYFTNTENQARIARADWLFPVRHSALARPEFRAEEFEWDVAYEWVEHGWDVKGQMFAFLAWESQSFLPQFELAILGRQSIDAVLESAVREGNRFLRRMGLQ